MHPPVSISSGGRPVIVDLSLDAEMVEAAIADRALGGHDADVLDRFAHDLAVTPDGFEHGRVWATLAAAWLRVRAAVLRAGQRPSIHVHHDQAD